MPRRVAASLARFSADYVLDRRQSLMDAAGDRNADMDRYEDMYCLDVWTGPKGESEQRVTLPIAQDLVEKERALLLARQFQVSVPASGQSASERSRAQKIERYLYGVIDRTNLHYHTFQAAWHANCNGRGWLKAVYDDKSAEDEYPILITTPDPRTIYYTYDARKEHLTELVHTWERTRREIETEWEVTLPGAPDDDPHQSGASKLDAWLDETTCYTEYWTVETKLEEVKEDEDEDEDEPIKGVIELAAEDYMSRSVAANSQAQPPTPPGGIGGMEGAPPSIGDYLETQPEPEAEEEPAKKPKKQRVRKVVHTIIAGEGEEATVIKKPVYLPGYKRIPYFGWSGVETPMSGGRDSLSILFAAGGGDDPDHSGVLQTYNLVASLYLDEAVRRVHAPVITDDQEANIDTAPDAIIDVKRGSTVSYLQPPPAPPALMQIGEMMGRQLDRVGPPEVWNGQAHNLSGQAISGLANAYQMRIALKQHMIEKALRALFEHVLCLTSQYADPDEGWRAYGTGSYGRFVEESLTADDIGDHYRVTVKLSASLPKDEVALTMMFWQLSQQNGISWETFLDQFQKMHGMAADSPEEEIERVFSDMILREKEFAKRIAEAKAEEFVALMQGKRNGISLADLRRAEMLRNAQPAPRPAPPILRPPGQPPAPEGPPGEGIPQQGAGLPPGAAPPTPDTVAASGNLGAAMNMPGLMGGGPQI